jgi:hypothetical protein
MSSDNRWTVVLGSGGELLAAHEGAATEDYNGLTPVEVVPCDEAAIERVAQEMASWSGPVPSGVNGFRPYAERVLRAAGGDRTRDLPCEQVRSGGLRRSGVTYG